MTIDDDTRRPSDVAGPDSVLGPQSSVLYRKWRSRRFDDLVGQPAVTQTLRNAVQSGRVAHAYLFCGPRGVGKTSAARILAKALNCEAPRDGEPCNACESCRAINDGRALDVIEIDAASNRGIDDIRNLRERVGFTPAGGRYKLYILDEAHMLSTDAFNALLKTLEEPPPNTIFVLVTTEAQKVPETVLSRCQRLDFRRIPIGDVIARLAYICDQEAIAVEPGVLETFGRSASGSLRDAEGLLDQVIAYAGHEVTLADARAVIGIGGAEAARTLIRSIGQGEDAAEPLRQVARLVEEGAEPRQLAGEIVDALRTLVFLRVSDGLADVVDATPEELPALRELSRQFTVAQLVELVRIFSAVPAQTRTAIRAQLPLEMAIVEATVITGNGARASAPPAPARARVDAPAWMPVGSSAVRETAPVVATTADGAATTVPANGGAVPPVSPARPGAPALSSDPGEPRAVDVRVDAPAVPPSPDGQRLLEESTRRWLEIIEAFGGSDRRIQALLRSAWPVAVEGDALVLGFQYPFHKERIEDPKNRGVVEDVLAQVLGARVRVSCVKVEREAIRDPYQAALDDPLVKTAVSLGARVRRVIPETGPETSPETGATSQAGKDEP